MAGLAGAVVFSMGSIAPDSLVAGSIDALVMYPARWRADAVRLLVGAVGFGTLQDQSRAAPNTGAPGWAASSCWSGFPRGIAGFAAQVAAWMRHRRGDIAVVDGLHKAFGGNRAVDGVDFADGLGRQPRDGPNGAGKSTVCSVRGNAGGLGAIPLAGQNKVCSRGASAARRWPWPFQIAETLLSDVLENADIC